MNELAWIAVGVLSYGGVVALAFCLGRSRK